MFSLTKQERTVLFFLAWVLLTGSCVRYLLNKYPSLNSIINVVERDDVYLKLDINKASMQELVEIPYIGEMTARKIIEYREAKGVFKDLKGLMAVQGIRLKSYERFKKYLTVR